MLAPGGDAKMIPDGHSPPPPAQSSRCLLPWGRWLTNNQNPRQTGAVLSRRHEKEKGVVVGVTGRAS